MTAMKLALYTLLIITGCFIVRDVVQRKWKLDGATWAAFTVLLMFICFGISIEISRPLNSIALEIVMSILAIAAATCVMIGVAGFWHKKHTQSHNS